VAAADAALAGGSAVPDGGDSSGSGAGEDAARKDEGSDEDGDVEVMEERDLEQVLKVRRKEPLSGAG